jgi:polyhydroxyalkanoate synthase subunit PhaE
VSASSDPKGASTASGDNAANPLEGLLRQAAAPWAASLGALSAWSEAWRSMLEQRGAPATAAMLKALNPASWPDGFGPLLDEIQNVFALPHFADLPRPNGSPLPSPRPMVELMLVAQQYILEAAPVWAQACQRFQEEAAERRARGEAIDSAGEAMDLWNNVLDRTLMEFNRSAGFAKVQQRFLHAAMRQRREVRKTVESAAKAVDLPTRTEINDVYQRLHDLTREVHGLRREVRALRNARESAQRASSAPAREAQPAGRNAPPSSPEKQDAPRATPKPARGKGKS